MVNLETQNAQETVKSGTRFAEKSTNFVEKLPLSGFWFAAIGSMGISALLFIIGKRQQSNFVGLWVPSLISLALFYKVLRPSKEVSDVRRNIESNGF